jgi:hypothetical protein
MDSVSPKHIKPFTFFLFKDIYLPLLREDVQEKHFPHVQGKDNNHVLS